MKWILLSHMTQAVINIVKAKAAATAVQIRSVDFLLSSVIGSWF
jgi:hypothetical protein